MGEQTLILALLIFDFIAQLFKHLKIKPRVEKTLIKQIENITVNVTTKSDVVLNGTQDHSKSHEAAVVLKHQMSFYRLEISLSSFNIKAVNS